MGRLAVPDVAPRTHPRPMRVLFSAQEALALKEILQCLPEGSHKVRKHRQGGRRELEALRSGQEAERTVSPAPGGLRWLTQDEGTQGCWPGLHEDEGGAASVPGVGVLGSPRDQSSRNMAG